MKIGSLSLRNNIFLAPMAGITDLSFRLLNREFGVGLAFTEMISAAGLIRGTGKTYHYLNTTRTTNRLACRYSDPIRLSLPKRRKP
jgi:tRNA-dihydrouridine synthase